jgi:hypothetical protein
MKERAGQEIVRLFRGCRPQRKPNRLAAIPDAPTEYMPSAKTLPSGFGFAQSTTRAQAGLSLEPDPDRKTLDDLDTGAR